MVVGVLPEPAGQERVAGSGPDRPGDSAVRPALGAGDDVQPRILPAGVLWARACRSSAAALELPPAVVRISRQRRRPRAGMRSVAGPGP